MHVAYAATLHLAVLMLDLLFFKPNNQLSEDLAIVQNRHRVAESSLLAQSGCVTCWSGVS